MEETKKILLNLPSDWLAAFETAAQKAHMPLSAWLRVAAAKQLPVAARSKLSEPLRPGPKPRNAN